MTIDELKAKLLLGFECKIPVLTPTINLHRFYHDNAGALYYDEDVKSEERANNLYHRKAGGQIFEKVTVEQTSQLIREGYGELYPVISEAVIEASVKRETKRHANKMLPIPSPS